jgi:hypothetical protein
MMNSTLLRTISDDSKLLHEKYRVYRDGRVISLFHGHGIRIIPLVMNGTTREDGKNYVALRDEEGRTYNKARERIIAEMFIPNPLDHFHIRHKDGNKRNCHADNLEWSYYIPWEEETKEDLKQKRNKYMYGVMKTGDLVMIATSIRELQIQFKSAHETIIYHIEAHKPLFGKYYITRYEKGSAEADELRKLLHANKEKRHLQHMQIV